MIIISTNLHFKCQNASQSVRTYMSVPKLNILSFCCRMQVFKESTLDIAKDYIISVVQVDKHVVAQLMSLLVLFFP